MSRRRRRARRRPRLPRRSTSTSGRGSARRERIGQSRVPAPTAMARRTRRTLERCAWRSTRPMSSALWLEFVSWRPRCGACRAGRRRRTDRAAPPASATDARRLAAPRGARAVRVEVDVGCADASASRSTSRPDAHAGARSPVHALARRRSRRSRALDATSSSSRRRRRAVVAASIRVPDGRSRPAHLQRRSIVDAAAPAASRDVQRCAIASCRGVAMPRRATRRRSLVPTCCAEYGDVDARGAVPTTCRPREPRRHLYDLVADYPQRGGQMLRPSLCIATARAFGAPARGRGRTRPSRSSCCTTPC